MKELSIEEKAKRYDEAKYIMEEYLKSGNAGVIAENTIKHAFPELKESEDERIVKELLTFFRESIHGGHILTNKEYDSWIAWLEKQGEQKPADKAEQKFEIGDLITNGILVGKIDKIHKWGYHAYFGDHYADVPDAENWHKWTVQDAKDGDVLVKQNGEMPFIFKSCENNHVYCYCGYTNRKDIFFDKFVNSENEELYWLNLYYEQACPATKEQSDLLFQKMKEAGYEWNAEKKELKKIEQSPLDVRTIGYWRVEDVEQKLAKWSEEDNRMCKAIIDNIQASYTSVEEFIEDFRKYMKGQ